MLETLANGILSEPAEDQHSIRMLIAWYVPT